MRAAPHEFSSTPRKGLSSERAGRGRLWLPLHARSDRMLFSKRQYFQAIDTRTLVAVPLGQFETEYIELILGVVACSS